MTADVADAADPDRPVSAFSRNRRIGLTVVCLLAAAALFALSWGLVRIGAERHANLQPLPAGRVLTTTVLAVHPEDTGGRVYATTIRVDGRLVRFSARYDHPLVGAPITVSYDPARPDTTRDLNGGRLAALVPIVGGITLALATLVASVAGSVAALRRRRQWYARAPLPVRPGPGLRRLVGAAGYLFGAAVLLGAVALLGTGRQIHERVQPLAGGATTTGTHVGDNVRVSYIPQDPIEAQALTGGVGSWIWYLIFGVALASATGYLMLASRGLTARLMRPRDAQVAAPAEGVRPRMGPGPPPAAAARLADPAHRRHRGRHDRRSVHLPRRGPTGGPGQLDPGWRRGTRPGRRRALDRARHVRREDEQPVPDVPGHHRLPRPDRAAARGRGPDSSSSTRVGTGVTVSYDPKNPTRAHDLALDRTLARRTSSAATALLGVAFLVAALWSAAERRRHRRIRRGPPAASDPAG